MNGSATGYFALLDLAVCGAGRLPSLTLAPSAARPPQFGNEVGERRIADGPQRDGGNCRGQPKDLGTVDLGKAASEKPGKIQDSRLLGSLAPAPSGLVSCPPKTYSSAMRKRLPRPSRRHHRDPQLPRSRELIASIHAAAVVFAAAVRHGEREVDPRYVREAPKVHAVVE